MDIEEFCCVSLDGEAITVRVKPLSSSRSNGETYNEIYRGRPFDLTTNSINGLQVKYLTPDGEAIPANE